MSQIKFATINDVDEIMSFIHNHWKHNHILSRNKDLFLYEHQDGNRINFVLHRNEGNKIDGILGFIKSSSKKSDIWTVLWKTLNNKHHPMLGVELFEFLRRSEDYKVLMSPGIDQKTINIYKYLKIYTDHFRNFVLLNNKIKQFKIAQIIDDEYLRPFQFQENSEFKLKLLSEEEVSFKFENYKDTIPYKDKEYFMKRYFNHPIYKYKVYGIFKNSEIDSILVLRKVVANNGKILRIVDFIGNQIGLEFVTHYLYKKIIKENYEYMDFMCFGFDYAQLIKSGFIEVNIDSSDLIIPNYFSPFLLENIQINFFADTLKFDCIKMCKADGDQDRPS